MKFATLLTGSAMLSLFIGLAGCADTVPPASIPNPDTPATDPDNRITGNDVQRELGEATDAVARYAGQTKEEYQAELQKKLDSLDARIEALNDKAAQASEETRASYDAALTTLRQKREVMSDKFAKVKEASGDAWQDVAAGADAAWDDLSKAFQNAASHFDSTADAGQPEEGPEPKLFSTPESGGA